MPSASFDLSSLGLPGVRYLTGTVRYFGSLSGIRMIAILDNACVNSSIFCTTNTSTASVHYFGKSNPSPHPLTYVMTKASPSCVKNIWPKLDVLRWFIKCFIWPTCGAVFNWWPTNCERMILTFLSLLFWHRHFKLAMWNGHNFIGLLFIQ